VEHHLAILSLHNIFSLGGNETKNISFVVPLPLLKESTECIGGEIPPEPPEQTAALALDKWKVIAPTGRAKLEMDKCIQMYTDVNILLYLIIFQQIFAIQLGLPCHFRKFARDHRAVAARGRNWRPRESHPESSLPGRSIGF